MSAIELKIDQESGELLPNSIMVPADKAPAILIDISDVQTYHNEPEKILEKIRIQAGFPVFDIRKKSGRDACRAHAANIIKTIAPAINASKTIASEAKKVINQDLAFRRDFEAGVREIAAFHRAPLTEYEEDQARIEEEKRLADLKLEESRLYFLAWEDALALNELHNLKREKEIEEKRIADEKEAEAARIIFESAVSERVERMKLRLAELTTLEDQEKKARDGRVFDEKYSAMRHILLDAIDPNESKSPQTKPDKSIYLTRTVLIDAVSAYLGITMRDAEKALYETFLI